MKVLVATMETQSSLTITLTDRRTGHQTVRSYGISHAVAGELVKKMNELVTALPPERVVVKHLTSLTDGRAIYDVTIEGEKPPLIFRPEGLCLPN